MFNTSYQIRQNVLLLQESQAATADNLEDRAPRALGWLSWGHYCTQSNPTRTTHIHWHTHVHTESGGRQQSPCHLRLRPAHVRPATPHTQLSRPRPPWCPTAATERLPECYFSSAEQTQKSACLKSMWPCRKKKNVLMSFSAVAFNMVL